MRCNRGITCENRTYIAPRIHTKITDVFKFVSFIVALTPLQNAEANLLLKTDECIGYLGDAQIFSSLIIEWENW